MVNPLGTRKQRAIELLTRIKIGPAFLQDANLPTIPRQRLIESYKQWAETWILSEIDELIPELRKEKKHA